MADEVDVLGLDWPDFKTYFAKRWQPGEHVAIVAPTGQAKTTVACGIVEQRKFVLVPDAKGGDSTLRSLGWPRMPWPLPREVYDQIAEGKPARYRIGNVVNTNDDFQRLQRMLSAMLDGVFEEGGWTVLNDESQIMADEMKLDRQLRKLMISARDKKVSMVNLFQRPSNVPRALADQATWLGVGMTRDRDVVDRMAEMMGRSTAEVRGRVSALKEYPFSWLFACNDPRVPLLVTIPWKPLPKPIEPPVEHRSRAGRWLFGR
jgi:hypothetical protein